MSKQYVDLEGVPMKWKAKSKPRENASKLHKRALSLIKEAIPNVYICQECLVKLPNKKKFYIDIFLPAYDIAIEVDGKQHDTFNSYFHTDKMAFAKQKMNDVIKENWCETNSIILVRFKEGQDDSQWKAKLLSCLSNFNSREV
jgi:hypothetical protein